MSEQPLADHLPYIHAVEAALEAAGVETEGIGGLPHWADPGPDHGRGAAVHLAGPMYWGRDEYAETVYLTVEWHETRGWYVHDTFEPGAVRGQAHNYMGLGLGIVPPPEEVARRVAEGLTEDGRLRDRGHTERKTGSYDAELEELLAAWEKKG